MRSLIIGYGNPSRGDDAAGIEIALAVEKLHLPDVEVRTCQQLGLELAEEFVHYEQVVLADASANGPEVFLENIDTRSENGSLQSHHLDAKLLARTASRLYGSQARVYLCTVLGENFEFGFGLDSQVKGRVREAVSRITGLLTEGVPHA